MKTKDPNVYPKWEGVTSIQDENGPVVKVNDFILRSNKIFCRRKLFESEGIDEISGKEFLKIGTIKKLGFHRERVIFFFGE